MASPTGEQVVVGSVAVEVTASARTLARTLRREVREAFNGVGQQIRRQVNRELRKAGPVRLNVDVDRLVAQVKRAARAAAKDAKVRLNVDVDRLVAQVKRAARAAAKEAKVKVGADADKPAAAAAGRKAGEEADRAAPPVRLRPEVDRSALQRAVGVLRAGMASLMPATMLSGGAAIVGLLGAGVSALLGGIGALLPPLVQGLSTLTTAGGALAALPGVIGAGVAALATFKVGLAGVGEALKGVAGDEATFNEAIKDLAPSAQEFARAIRELHPAFRDLRLDVQQRLFEGLGEAIASVAERSLPALRAGMGEVAEAGSSAFRNVLSALDTDGAVGRLEQVFAATAGTIRELGVVAGPGLAAALDVAGVGAETLAERLAGASGTLTGFFERVSAYAADGRLEELINNGLDVLSQFGSALADVGGILRGVFSASAAAGGEGGGLFGLLDRLNELVNSASGQETLTSLFVELGRIGDALLPVLGAVGQALVPVAQAVGDIAVAAAPFLERLAGALGSALASLEPAFVALLPAVDAISAALGPIATIIADLVVGMAPGVTAFLEALGSGLELLAPVAGVVGEALGNLLAAAAPLLEVLGFALGEVLTVAAVALSGLSEPIGVFARLIGDLAVTAGQSLLPILVDLAEQLLPIFADAALQVGEALEPLLPAYAELAEHVSGKLADALPDLVDAFGQLAAAFAEVGSELAQAVVDAILALVPHLPDLVDATLELALAFADLVVQLTPILPAIGELLVAVLELVTPVVLEALVDLVTATAGAMRLLAQHLPTVLAFLAPIVGLLQVDWSGIGEAIGGFFSDAWDAVSGFFSDVFEWASSFPGEVASKIGDVATTLKDKGLELLQGLWDGATERWSAAKEWFAGIPDRVITAIGNLASTLHRKGVDLLSGLRQGVIDRYTAVRDWVAGIPDRVKTAIGDLGRLLYQTGKDILSGLKNGLQDALPNVLGVAGDIAGSIKNSVKSALGIDSPSKVMRDEVGRWIPAGIAAGIRRSENEPVRALDDLVARMNTTLSADLAASVSAPTPATYPTPPGLGMDVHLHDSQATVAHLEALLARLGALHRVGMPA